MLPDRLSEKNEVACIRLKSPTSYNIEYELGKRDVSVSRDLAFLKPGQDYAQALQQEVKGTDCFIVLISPNAAK